MTDPLKLDRALAARALAIAMPWYLDFLAVWMLNYEARRIEAMIREMCEGIEALAKATVAPAKRPKAEGIDWSLLSRPGAFIPVGSLMDAMIVSKAAKAAAQSAYAQPSAAQMAAYQNNLAQQQAVDNLMGLGQQFNQRRSMLNNVAGNMFGPIP